MESKRFRLFILALAILITLHLECSLAAAQAITSVRRASLAPHTNLQGESYSYDPSISGDGRFVVFTSTADSFAARGKVTGKFHEHAYLRDTITGTTTQLDITPDGTTGAPGSAFSTNERVFRSGLHPHISRDGNFVVFASSESNLVTDGTSSDFGSWAYLRNVKTGDTTRIPSPFPNDTTMSVLPSYLAINGDGSRVVVINIVGSSNEQNCANCGWEISLYDRNSNTTEQISTGAIGNKYNPMISDDGRFLVFENQEDHDGSFSAPTYAFLYDIETKDLVALNGGQAAHSPAISADGNIIAYSTMNELPSRIRIRERLTRADYNIGFALGGGQPNGISDFPSLSQDGRYVAFLSNASNLVKNDLNNLDDIFVVDRVTSKTTLVSVQEACPGVATTEDFNTGPPSLSLDGKTLTFAVLERLVAGNTKVPGWSQIEPADTNRFDDVYVATVDYNAKANIFNQSLTPTTPLVSISCTGESARFQVAPVVKPGASVNSQKEAVLGQSIKSISNEIQISGVTSDSRRKDIRKQLISRRNDISDHSLPPGNYTARVRARATLSNGKSNVSRYSIPRNFVVTSKSGS